MNIPNQLRNENFRFCKVLRGEKRPFEGNWVDNNYTWNDQRLTQHISEGGNYGVIGGNGKLLIIDFDNKEAMEKALTLLPTTFSVRTAGKGLLHMYYFCDEPYSCKVLDAKGETIADIQGSRKIVVGPGSKLANGKEYSIENDTPISTISRDIIIKAFEGYDISEIRMKSEINKEQESKDTDPLTREIKKRIKISTALKSYGIKNVPSRSDGNCDCPLHESKNHACFHYSDDTNQWHCFHCGKGGSVIDLAAYVMKLDPKKDFYTVRDELANKYNIEVGEEFAQHFDDAISNAVPAFNEEGEKTVRNVDAPVIVKDVLEKLEGWPKCLNGDLFFVKDKTIHSLLKVEDLFAWMMNKYSIRWLNGMCKLTFKNFTSRQEFMSSLKYGTKNYIAAYNLPHVPNISDVYYIPQEWPTYKPDGRYLEVFLDFFNNTDSKHDRDLIRAMVCTPMWGGPTGKRPCFYIDANDRGSGKSTLTTLIGDLYGGMFDISPESNNTERATSGLFEDNTAMLRIIRIDNLKHGGLKVDSFIESLITNKEFSGHRMYVGHRSRPNYFTIFITANNMLFTRDMAERSYNIRLKRPDEQARFGWDRKVSEFMNEYRLHVLLDIMWTLNKQTKPYTTKDRWQLWVNDVLAKCSSDVESVIEHNAIRRDESDEEQEELMTIEEALRNAKISPMTYVDGISIKGEVYEKDGVWNYITTTALSTVLERHFNRKLTTRHVTFMLKKYINNGKLKAEFRRKNTSRGYYLHDSFFDTTNNVSVSVSEVKTPEQLITELLNLNNGKLSVEEIEKQVPDAERTLIVMKEKGIVMEVSPGLFVLLK